MFFTAFLLFYPSFFYSLHNNIRLLLHNNNGSIVVAFAPPCSFSRNCSFISVDSLSCSDHSVLHNTQHDAKILMTTEETNPQKKQINKNNFTFVLTNWIWFFFTDSLLYIALYTLSLSLSVCHDIIVYTREATIARNVTNKKTQAQMTKYCCNIELKFCVEKGIVMHWFVAVFDLCTLFVSVTIVYVSLNQMHMIDDMKY